MKSGILAFLSLIAFLLNAGVNVATYIAGVHLSFRYTWPLLAAVLVLFFAMIGSLIADTRNAVGRVQYMNGEELYRFGYTYSGKFRPRMFPAPVWMIMLIVGLAMYYAGIIVSDVHTSAKHGYATCVDGEFWLCVYEGSGGRRIRRLTPQEAAPFESREVWMASGGSALFAFLTFTFFAYRHTAPRMPVGFFEGQPSRWLRLKDIVPLPASLEVEELPDGVCYSLPADAAIILGGGRLRGQSGQWGRGRFSQPAHRVRRLLAWRMGIWVECDGSSRRLPLLFSYDASNLPDPCLLAGVAQDLARRMYLAGFGHAGRRGVPVLFHVDLVKQLPGAGAEFKPFTGQLDGEVFHVDSLAEGFVAVWIEIPSEEMSLPPMFEINPKYGGEPVDDPERQAEIAALFELGARDVDVGFHGDEARAEFPMEEVGVNRKFAERVVGCLIALKRVSLAKNT